MSEYGAEENPARMMFIKTAGGELGVVKSEWWWGGSVVASEEL